MSFDVSWQILQQDNIERKKRRDEYRRMQMLKQMEQRNKKVEVRQPAFPVDFRVVKCCTLSRVC